MFLRTLVVAPLGLMAGCVGLAASGSVHAPISSAETRVASGNLAFGTWFAIRRQVLVDLDMGYELGPLGNKSNALFTVGGRVSTTSHGWRPGYYGTLLGGSGYPNDLKNWAAGPTGSAVRVSFGVAWTRFAREDGELGPIGYSSAMLGVAYHRQEQSNIGAGDFLGIELTLAVGGDLWYSFSKWQPKDH